MLALLQFAVAPTHAQSGAVVIGNEASYVLSRSFADLDDTRAALTLEQVLQPALQTRFKAVGRAVIKHLGEGMVVVRNECLPAHEKQGLLGIMNPVCTA